MTGIAVVIISESAAGNQPRKEDYAYVGSFYAFRHLDRSRCRGPCKDGRKKQIIKDFNNVLTIRCRAHFAITIMSSLRRYLAQYSLSNILLPLYYTSVDCRCYLSGKSPLFRGPKLRSH